jgi:hypothetical protein
VTRLPEDLASRILKGSPEAILYEPAFARRKQHTPLSARLERFETLLDNSAQFPVEAIGCPFTNGPLDGLFFQSVAPAAPLPVISVFSSSPSAITRQRERRV